MSSSSELRDQSASVVQRNQYKQEIPEQIREQIRALERKNNWSNLFYLGSDWLIILAVSALVVKLDMHPLAYLFAVVIIGSRQRALSNLIHEASHSKLFRKKVLNEWICRLFSAFPLGVSLTAYKADHIIHHGYLLNESKDTKAQIYRRLGLLPAPATRRELFLLHITRFAVVLHLARVGLSFLWQSGEPPLERVVRVSYWMGIGIVLIMTHALTLFLFFWVIPYCTAYLLLYYLSQITNHVGLEADDAWQATRNWTASPLTCWLLAPHSDDLYHLTHHLFPLIPHYHLAKAHRILLRVPAYQQAHHCEGYFFPRRPGARYVLGDLVRSS